MNGLRHWVAALAPVAMLGATPAAAAPQSIGLIASLEPVSLTCERGECGAEFTAFCVERYRQSPNPGTAYFPHDGDSLTIEGVRDDGTTVVLDVIDRLTVVTERGHSAVRLSLPDDVLEQHDVAALRIAVGEKATLLPEAIPGDPKPLTTADVMLATGPLRAAAAAIIDEGGPRIDAARITSRLINALPRGGRADEVQRATVWDRVAPSPRSPGYTLARDGFESCATLTRSGLRTLRQCLGSKHDTFVGELNTRYWHALEIGS